MTRWFLWLARLEGISFLLLLFVAMPLKYYAGSAGLVRIMGPVHGMLFLAYVAAVLWYALDENWSLKKHLLGYASAVLPFGTFLFEKAYFSPKSIRAKQA